MTRIIRALSEVSAQYDALFMDLWGCLHDGVTPFPEAVAALQAFRASGGVVALVTNSPKPRAGVERQLDAMGVPRDCWDTIASSGDSARLAMFNGVVGRAVYYIGTEADLPFFEPMELAGDTGTIARVPLTEAEGIVCTGPRDPLADPDVYAADFLYAKTTGLKLLCANPDIVVDRGGVREWCAGALAARYTEMGGESLYFGKPHPPIYDLARRRLAALGRDIPDGRILAVGDGIATDIRGALGEDIDTLFVTGGLARQETQTVADPDPDALSAFVAREKTEPTFAIGQLR